MKTTSRLQRPINRLGKIAAIMKSQRCLYLLTSQLALMVLYPYLTLGTGDKTVFSQIAISVVLLTGVSAVSRKRSQLVVSTLFLIPAMVGNWIDVKACNPKLAAFLEAGLVLFFISMSAMVLRYMFQGKRYATDKIFGALSIYLLIAMAFASLYHILYVLDANCFAFEEILTVGGQLNWSHFIYLSVITQTTLGYGDITPVTSSARSLISVQAVIGPMYLAVLLAWLVGSLRPGAASGK